MSRIDAEMVQVLVIEDEEPIRENIVETLKINKFDVISANCGEDGVELAQEYQPELILCDIMMTGMDGYDVLNHVRRTSDISLTPFIFLTAKSDRASMRYGMELGADDYIPKPFTTDELLSAINARINRLTDVAEQSSEELTQTKKQLAHVISHELRTPLTSINMAVQLMSQQLDFLSTDDIHDLVDTLGNGTNRLNRLVEQMTLFVEARSGLLSQEKVRVISRPEPVWTLILGAINHAHHFIYRDHNVQVNFDPQQYEADISCFRQTMIHALAELIANAISYSPQDAQVDITLKRYDKGVRVRIEDYGVGMMPAEIETALQDFSQIDRDIHEQQGIGIGLPLANLIIQSHGGRLDIQSEKGKGTRVHIYLPYQQ